MACARSPAIHRVRRRLRVRNSDRRRKLSDHPTNRNKLSRWSQDHGREAQSYAASGLWDPSLQARSRPYSSSGPFSMNNGITRSIRTLADTVENCFNFDSKIHHQSPEETSAITQALECLLGHEGRHQVLIGQRLHTLGKRSSVSHTLLKSMISPRYVSLRLLAQRTSLRGFH